MATFSDDAYDPCLISCESYPDNLNSFTQVIAGTCPCVDGKTVEMLRNDPDLCRYDGALIAGEGCSDTIFVTVQLDTGGSPQVSLQFLDATVVEYRVSPFLVVAERVITVTGCTGDITVRVVIEEP